MFIPEKLKLNKFELVRIPRAKEYISRFGLNPSPASSYSGDDVISNGSNKVENLAAASRAAAKEAEEFYNSKTE